MDPGAAEEGPRARCGAVCTHGATGCSLVLEPDPQRVDMPIGSVLEATDYGRASDAQLVLGRDDALHGWVRLGLPVHSSEQDRSPIQVELPCGDNAKLDRTEQLHQRGQ